MDVVIKIPEKGSIISRGIEVKLAPKGESWFKSQLGDKCDSSGVYVQHHKEEILYVGKTTDGNWGTFAERLRREFQQTSSQNSPLYQALAKTNDVIQVTMLTLEEIETMFKDSSLRLDPKRQALILEQVLIATWDPRFNKI